MAFDRLTRSSLVHSRRPTIPLKNVLVMSPKEDVELHRNSYDVYGLECAAGEFTARTLLGKVWKCHKCPAGKHQPNPNSLRCKSCPTGQSMDPGAAALFKCRPGKWSAAPTLAPTKAPTAAPVKYTREPPRMPSPATPPPSPFKHNATLTKPTVSCPIGKFIFAIKPAVAAKALAEAKKTLAWWDTSVEASGIRAQEAGALVISTTAETADKNVSSASNHKWWAAVGAQASAKEQARLAQRHLDAAKESQKHAVAEVHAASEQVSAAADTSAEAKCVTCAKGKTTNSPDQDKCVAIPTPAPTSYPTDSPTAPPTPVPTQVPTVSPTPHPTVYPTASPTASPTLFSCDWGQHLVIRNHAVFGNLDGATMGGSDDDDGGGGGDLDGVTMEGSDDDDGGGGGGGGTTPARNRTSSHYWLSPHGAQLGGRNLGEVRSPKSGKVRADGAPGSPVTIEDCVDCPHGRFQADRHSRVTQCPICPTGRFQHMPGQRYCYWKVVTATNRTFPEPIDSSGKVHTGLTEAEKKLPDTPESHPLSPAEYAHKCAAITTFAECVEAASARALGRVHNESTGEFPKGCYKMAGNYAPVYFNADPFGSRHEGATALCAATSAPTPAPVPTIAPTPHACSPGQFQTNWAHGRYSCAWCPHGKFSEHTNSDECSKCPQSTTWPAHAPAQCQPCPRGEYRPSTSSTQCHNCTFGYFKSWIQEETCLHCPKGKYQSKRFYKDCEPCPLALADEMHHCVGVTSDGGMQYSLYD